MLSVDGLILGQGGSLKHMRVKKSALYEDDPFEMKRERASKGKTFPAGKVEPT